MVLSAAMLSMGGDFPPGQSTRRKRAGPHGLTIDMHGAGAAEARTAAEFGAGQAERIAQDPESGVSASASTSMSCH